MENPSPPPVFVSWFPGCAEPETLDKLSADTRAAGVEMRHLDDDARAISASDLRLSFHLPTPPQEQVMVNLATEDILTPYREGRMGLLSLSDAPFVGYHCGYSCLRVRKMVGPEQALSPTLGREETADRIAATITELRRLTGKRVLVENMDYGPTGAMEYVCEPPFIRELCERAGCGAIWDIGHALVSAAPLGSSENDYMESFVSELAPLLGEIHINSPSDGMDAHLPATRRELDWLRRMLAAGARPHCVVLERAWGEESGPHFAERLKPEVAQLLEMCSDFPGRSD